MRGRKAVTCYWCSKGITLETFNCKKEEQKSTRHGGQGLIYKTSFFIFTSVFAIFLAFQQAYIEFTEQLDKLDTEKSRTSGTLRQFQERTGQESKTDIHSAFISIQYQYKAVLKLILKTILILNRLLNIESRLRIYRALIL